MQLFIPKKINVGFQPRQDTYTGKLAYVIYYDQKGKLRKETSWQSWRDKKIEPVECENVPTSGFVLNKGVGGTRESYGWNSRNEYIRVYDPRDFEFEISVSNLLFILRECDCSKGKGLEGEFVYAWEGTELVLLPAKSNDFQSCSEYTDLQSKSVKVKELVEGVTYLTKKQSKLTYLGKLDRYHLVFDQKHDYVYYGNDRKLSRSDSGVGTYHVFITENGSYKFLTELKSLAAAVDQTPAANLAELKDSYYKSEYGSPIVEFSIEPTKETKKEQDYGYTSFWKRSGDIFYEYQKSNYKFHNERDRFTLRREFIIEKGIAKTLRWHDARRSNMTEESNQLYVKLASGSKFKMQDARILSKQSKLEDECDDE